MEIGRGEAVFLRGAEGDILASVDGDMTSIADFLQANMPNDWMMNSTMGHPLPGLLAERGWQVDLKPSNLQMWLSLDESISAAEMAARGRFSVIDRF